LTYDPTKSIPHKERKNSNTWMSDEDKQQRAGIIILFCSLVSEMFSPVRPVNYAMVT
jgi:hypothetical protein